MKAHRVDEPTRALIETQAKLAAFKNPTNDSRPKTKALVQLMFNNQSSRLDAL